MAGKRIRLLLVDDHEVVRQGLRFMLDMEEDMEVVGGASSAIEALKLAAALRPDIVLVDIKVPPSNGLKLTRQLKEWGLAREVIILSLHEEYLAQAIEAGAGGYLLKGGKREELANAIRRVHRGEMFLAESLLTSPSLVEAAFRHFRQVVRWPRSREPTTPSPPGGQPLVPPPQEPAVTPPVPPAPPMGFPPLSPVPGAPSLPTSLDISWRMDAPAMPPPAESLLPPPFSPVLEHSGVGTTPTTAFPSAGAQELQWPDYPAKEADLIVPPPVDTALLLSLLQRLREHGAEILSMEDSGVEGAWIKLLLKGPVALKDLLRQMPEVASAGEIEHKGEGSPPDPGAPPSGTGPAPQLRVVLHSEEPPEAQEKGPPDVAGPPG